MFSSQAKASSIHCLEPRQDTSVIRFITECDEQGQLIEVRGYFIKTGAMSLWDRRVGTNQRLRQTFNSSERVTSNFEISELGGNQERWFEVNTRTGKLVSDRTFAIQNPSNPHSNRLLSQRHFDEGGELVREDFYDSKRRVKRRHIISHESLPAGEAKFTYDESQETAKDRIQSYIYKTEDGEVLAKLSADEVTSPVPRSQERPWAAMVIDTGFDTAHPQLAEHVAPNPNEPVDGIDNDGNGYVDDGAGWNFRTNSAKLLEPLYESQDDVFPYSHGTHVASVAFDGVRQFRFLGVSGETLAVALVEARKYIQRDHVRFVNMSFAWDGGNRGMTPGGAATSALSNLVSQSPKALFTVAAGNIPIELIPGKSSCEIPACLQRNNMVVVSALKASSFADKELVDADLAREFTSFGERIADVAAPGVLVPGAFAGGGQVPMTGTSMAAPLVQNLLLKMAEKNYGLSNSTLKEVLMKTVYIADINKPLPVRSGGAVFPRRALRVIESMKDNPAGSVEEHILKVRREPGMLLGFESNGAEDLAKLKKLWKRVDLVLDRQSFELTQK